MRILGLIPARGGSKGIPGKNIKLLGGKPLIQYTSEIALQSKFLSKVVLSSDNESIIEVGRRLGLEIPFTRSAELAKDDTPTISVIKHVLDFYESNGEIFDAVCLLQVTSPFRTIEFLDEAIQKFIEEDSDSLISVLEVPHEYNPHWTFELNEKEHLKIATGDKKIITRRQELPKAYHRDGSIYLTKTTVIREQSSLLGDSISYIESLRDRYVNIDTEKDWKIAEDLIERIY